MATPNPLARDAAAALGPPMEHRFGRRYACGSPVRISAGDEASGDGQLVNVSMSGAYLQTELDLPLFALISLVKIRKDDRTPVELLASVVRRDGRGVGVEWCETPGRSICHVLGCPHPCHP